MATTKRSSGVEKQPSGEDKAPAADAAAPPKPKPTIGKPPSTETAYLFVYNFLSSVLWFTVFSRTLTHGIRFGFEGVYPGVGLFARVTQTLATLEITHSLTGLVRAPLMTTLMQISSRILLVWGVTYPFPELAASPAYTTMLLAWSVTEVIRYSFFAASTAGTAPSELVWLRYNTFFVLYPMGILSETWLIYQAAVGPAAAVRPELAWVLYAILAIYVPGSYILYTHMMKQRVKVMRKLKGGDVKKTQ
ncbi:related to protein tyrosine phosphatase-like protein (putative anti-phosphatase); pepino protein; pasticcino protein pas2 [Cephalotrichum gorgonifer]|uniref:Very-long-chain (3R)-3-hydroxyacyl-CoA dehydratase n=1 Tax=Cephalotrichum gorgonifer TaxID=2041049 RepID=A0AAE8SX89_9PEZI|nr:related to protein tyrosine phosphatase-like protein (putative anti-phosphatase); pepino protein; pasticcino protein pas2 [Cephalotrichum gorgonifer]